MGRHEKGLCDMTISTMRMSRDELRQYLQSPQPCRCCGQAPDMAKEYWNAEHTLSNWAVACRNPECKVQPYLAAYSWDDREMAVARWNDAWGC